MIIKPCFKGELTLSICLLTTVLMSSVVHAGSVGTPDNDRASMTLQRWLNKNVNDHPSVLAAKAAVDSAGYQLIAADKALYNPELEFDAETAETDSASIARPSTGVIPVVQERRWPVHRKLQRSLVSKQHVVK